MATGKPPWSNYAAPVAAMFQIASSKDPPPIPEHLSPQAKDFLLMCFNRRARWRLRPRGRAPGSGGRQRLRVQTASRGGSCAGSVACGEVDFQGILASLFGVADRG
jgi:hypothetical protein